MTASPSTGGGGQRGSADSPTSEILYWAWLGSEGMMEKGARIQITPFPDLAKRRGQVQRLKFLLGCLTGSKCNSQPYHPELKPLILSSLISIPKMPSSDLTQVIVPASPRSLVLYSQPPYKPHSTEEPECTFTHTSLSGPHGALVGCSSPTQGNSPSSFARPHPRAFVLAVPSAAYSSSTSLHT